MFLIFASPQLLQSNLFLAKGQTIVDSWPSFGHDLQNTRFSSSSAPRLPNLLWKFDAQFFGSEEVAASGGRVFVGSTLTQDFYSLNETNGSLLWKTQLNGTIGDKSPVVNEKVVIVGTTSGHVYCLDIANGSKIWEATLPLDAPALWPVISNGRVFIGFSGNSDPPYHLYCLNLVDGAKIWEYQGVGWPPAVVDGKIFVGGVGLGGGKVCCLDEANGTKIWEFPSGIGSGSPAVVNGRVYVGTEDRRVYCLNQTNGQIIWYKICSGSPNSISYPAVAYGNVFIVSKGDGSIYCLDADSGTEKWVKRYGVNQIHSSLSIADGMIFVMKLGYSNPLEALNATDGTLIWNYALPSEFQDSRGSSVAIADGKLFISVYGSICCIGSPYSLTVNPIFRDNEGNTLNPSPSAWRILFSNGTTILVPSSSADFPLITNGQYSITSVLWQGIEVVPDNKPTIYFDRNFTWNPIINCKLPAQLKLDLETSTSFIGFSVNISGRFADYKNMSLNGAQILLAYSATGQEPWNTITAINTATDGSYSALWMPTATGNFVLKATYQDSETYPNANTSLNLAIIPYETKNVFSVISNSTVSALTFNSQSNVLSFTTSGSSGTTGFANVNIAKTLVGNITNLKVYLDGVALQYQSTSTSDSWILTFTYSHSAHNVRVDLGTQPSPTPTPTPNPTPTPTTKPTPASTPTPTLTFTPAPTDISRPTSSIPTEYLLAITALVVVVIALIIVIIVLLKKRNISNSLLNQTAFL
jgi:outer membrane protein assembly factor BamB